MWHFDMPLAWLAGAIIATGVGALFGLPVAIPPFARLPMTAAIGAMLGTSFSPAVFEHAGWWPSGVHRGRERIGLHLFPACGGI
ncbi:hypothetical protein GHK48_30815 [Sinorhizobium fredii]|uniref:Uncharacterized protein n=2 Tax=Rhizobium fredii TaxID=380 RepID=I3XGU8_SINF2|nr:hypothetical protein USDA257_p03890 [Sinorhizobium fredii USDA 257]MQX12496.1 hypothetical protein [Sinorhizobium fredii]